MLGRLPIAKQENLLVRTFFKPCSYYYVKFMGPELIRKYMALYNAKKL